VKAWVFGSAAPPASLARLRDYRLAPGALFGFGFLPDVVVRNAVTCVFEACGKRAVQSIPSLDIVFAFVDRFEDFGNRWQPFERGSQLPTRRGKSISRDSLCLDFDFEQRT
jgi:hypothetical protein